MVYSNRCSFFLASIWLILASCSAPDRELTPRQEGDPTADTSNHQADTWATSAANDATADVVTAPSDAGTTDDVKPVEDIASRDDTKTPDKDTSTPINDTGRSHLNDSQTQDTSPSEQDSSSPTLKPDATNSEELSDVPFTEDAIVPSTEDIIVPPTEDAMNAVGCTDSDAANYDTDANVDNGQCEYDVTFSVDMATIAGFDPQQDTVHINGSFNDGCGTCAPLVKSSEGSTVYQITIALKAGSYEYLFTTNGWAGLEEKVPPACDFIPSDEFQHRGVTVTDTPIILDPVCFNSCDICSAVAPEVTHTFHVDMGCTDISYTDVFVTGPWAGGWCGDCYPLTDIDGDGIWSGSYTFNLNDVIEYKYTVDNWAHQEDLVDDMTAGASCAPITNYNENPAAPYANRSVLAGEMSAQPDIYGSCTACDTAVVEEPDSASGYTLFWADEFNGTTLADHWEPLLGDGSAYNLPGWGNNESQWYASDQASVSNGTLIITAEPTPGGPGQYASARLRTTFGFRYGRIEARIKLPYGQGIWPAFWMLPMTGQWPLAGEIDIMEVVGHTPDELHGTIHLSGPNGHYYTGGSTVVSGLSETFHTYGVTWTEGKIVWDIDGVTYFTQTENGVAPAAWPFDERHFHILLNLAVGGTWPGYPDATTVFPQTMTVDWVRVYKSQVPPASTPPVEGCMNPVAANFSPTAEVDDGSCKYPVILAVDMASSTINPNCGVHVFGTFNNWQVWLTPLEDNDNDQVWTTQLLVGADEAIQYKFANCGDFGVESLSPGTACVETSDTYTNRVLTVTGPIDASVSPPCFGSCEACP